MEVHIDQSYSLRDLLQDVKDGVLNVDYLLQRDAEQWKNKDKSLLIDSVLRGIVIKPITVMQKGTGDEAERFLTDGKQRVTTLAQFKNGEFKLSKSIKSITIRVPKMVDKVDADGNVVKELLPGNKRRTVVKVPELDENGEKIYELVDFKLANKTYGELPKVLKDKFNRYNKMLVIRMIDCTPEQIRLQMIRDNISVKMNPAQIGTIVGGEQVAQFTRGFRNHNLFLNQSNWTENEIKKDAIERCITEAFVLSYMPDLWGGYDKNVSLFTDNATKEAFEETSSLIDRLSAAIDGCDVDKESLCAKNMYIIVANFKAFVDLEEYSDADYGKFLAKWFEEIKDSTDYPTFDATSTKSKRIVLSRLDIMNEAMTEYMSEYGTPTEEVVDKPCDAVAFKTISEYENSLSETLGLPDSKIARFNSKALMIASDFHYGDLEDDTLENFRDYFERLSWKDVDNIEKDAQYFSDCVNDRLNEIPYDSTFVTADNVLCLLMVEKRAQKEEVSDYMSGWVKEFTSEYTDDCVYANIREDQAGYIMGRYSYLWSSFEKYTLHKMNEEDN